MDQGPVRNFNTKRPYHAGNRLILEYLSLKLPSKEWITLKQANSIGGKIRKGAKGVPIYYWNSVKKEIEEEDEDTGEAKIERHSFLKLYNVFNVSQTTLDFDPPEIKQHEFTPNERAEQIHENYKDKPTIFHDAQTPFYDIAEDSIYLPEIRRFTSIDRYYGTKFHESIHSTGHKNRLDRLEKIVSKRDDEYSKEELIAELGSCYLCSEAGLDMAGKMEVTASYIEGWSKTLRKHPTWFINASSSAEKAANYILGRINDTSN